MLMNNLMHPETGQIITQHEKFCNHHELNLLIR